MVAWALLWYAVGLVGHCLVEITSRAFYALHDTRTPVTVGVIAMSLNIIFSLAFSRAFQHFGLQPLGGLALANSLATGMEMAALLVLMRRRLNGMDGKEVLSAIIAGTVSGAGMAAILWIWLQYVQSQPAWLVLGAGLCIGVLVYGGLLVALRVHEIQQAWRWLSARIGH